MAPQFYRAILHYLRRSRYGSRWIEGTWKLAAGLFVLLAMVPLPAAGQCQWLLGDGVPGVDGTVYSMTTFDPDGPGGQPELLIVGGNFTVAGEVFANNIAAWNGSTWLPLGTGMNDVVWALTVFDDGGGPALYAGGDFTTAGGGGANYIAKWNGSSWSALGTGVNATVQAFTVFDDGDGPALYAGGWFTSAGGVSARRIAKWNGSSWSASGTGMNGGVFALTVFDDGGGPALYAGGFFTTAGGVSANYIAKWKGLSWSALGTGMNGAVKALTIFDDGSGSALYAGGDFTTAGGVSVNYIAKWNGSSWSALGTGMGGGYPIVEALTVFDDGGGPALYAGGFFTTAGGVSANYIAKWNGSAWSGWGTGMNDAVLAFTVFDDGGGPALYAGGQFTTAGGVGVSHIAKWNGSAWSGWGTGMNDAVLAFTVFDDGGGPALYAGGQFATAGGVSANSIAKWNGSSWSPLGTGMGGAAFPAFFPVVVALTVFDDGGGPALYAGGYFTAAGGVGVNRVAKWTGSSWSALGTGMNDAVLALTVFDDGGGPALYAGGYFTTAGGVGANSIAKWDGSSWSALDTGMNGGVFALTVFDDGGGPALYAGGYFDTAGGVSANNIAKWNGSSWSGLGTGIDDSVWALTVFADGGGPALYAGGRFTTAGGSSANFIAKWNGSFWSALGTGMGGANPVVGALTVFDDGSGPALFAGGGDFTTAGGVSANSIAKWNGSSWSALGTGMGGPTFPYVYALTVFDDGGGPALYAGGGFATAGGNVSAYWARWQCEACPSPLGISTYPHAARKQRYISFAPDSSHVNTSYRIKDVGSGLQYYVSTPRTTPASVSGQGLTFVVSDPSPILYDWSTLPVVHVGGCMIAPGDDAASKVGRAYEVTATIDGVIFSAPLTVYTAARPTTANARFWADVVGVFAASGDGTTTPPTPANSWTPANRALAGFDISAALQGAAAAATRPHFTWGDINPELTDRVASGPDVLRVVNAFGMGTGKEFYPFAYPVAPTTIHAPVPPSPALCPTPPLMAALAP